MKLIPVIMSGGVGSRLWPESREAHPKPFMQLPDGDNLIRKTWRRAVGLDHVSEVLTVTNRDLLFKTEDEYQLAETRSVTQRYILEPFGRNTAAAVASAAILLHREHGDDAVVLVLPADHLIRKEAAFAQAVKEATQMAAEGWLVTFGIKPESPETGFGYIETDSTAPQGAGYKVSRFVEKPDLATAEQYLAAGNFLWNSGMFCFRLGTLLGEMRQHCPKVLEAVEQAMDASRLSQAPGHSTLMLDADTFGKVPDISIDYALMERSQNVATVPCDIGWSDIGSWNAMSELTACDENGNRFEGEVMAWQAANNYVRSPERLTSLVGVENLIVVDTPDAILIADKSSSQAVRYIVGKLKQKGHDAHLLHRTVHRPWGTYTTLEEGDRFKIKRIVVKPGETLSLQMHHHRSEHWVVVSGMARIINDEQETLLDTNESTFIRAGHKHRLENPGVIDLVLIEVQCGDYLGEDDIVRYEDIYGRVDNK